MSMLHSWGEFEIKGEVPELYIGFILAQIQKWASKMINANYLASRPFRSLDIFSIPL